MRVDRLIAMRSVKGLTQDNVAELLGVKRQTYGAYERGVSTPDAVTIIELAKIFGTSSDYLLGLSDYINDIARVEFADQAEMLVSVLGEMVVGDRKDFVENLIRLFSYIQDSPTDVDTLAVIHGLYAQMIEYKNESIKIAKNHPIRYSNGRSTAISQQEFSVYLNKIIANKDIICTLMMLLSLKLLREVHDNSHHGGYEMERIARDTLARYKSSGLNEEGLYRILDCIDVKWEGSDPDGNYKKADE